MNTISQLPSLKNISGTVYVPAIKESSSGDYTNYKLDCNTLIYGGLTAINNLIKAYLDLHGYLKLDLSEYYNKEEVNTVLKKTLKDYLDKDTINNLINTLENSLITQADLDSLIQKSLSQYVTYSDLNDSIETLSDSVTNQISTVQNEVSKDLSNLEDSINETIENNNISLSESITSEVTSTIESKGYTTNNDVEELINSISSGPSTTDLQTTRNSISIDTSTLENTFGIILKTSNFWNTSVSKILMQITSVTDADGNTPMMDAELPYTLLVDSSNFTTNSSGYTYITSPNDAINLFNVKDKKITVITSYPIVIYADGTSLYIEPELYSNTSSSKVSIGLGSNYSDGSNEVTSWTYDENAKTITLWLDFSVADPYDLQDNSNNEEGLSYSFDYSISSTSLFYASSITSTNVNTEYVDLELPSGTLWCTYNLGATNIYGANTKYYSWGETTDRTCSYDSLGYIITTSVDPLFNVDNYPYKGNEFTPKDENDSANDHKYDFSELSLSNILATDYDIAYQKSNGVMQLPTIDLWNELINYCNWDYVYEYTGNEEHYYFLGVSKFNSEKKIYIPAIGWLSGSSDNSLKHLQTRYWTAKDYTGDSVYDSNGILQYINCSATGVGINKSFNNDYTPYVGHFSKYLGFGIRPVMVKKGTTTPIRLLYIYEDVLGYGGYTNTSNVNNYDGLCYAVSNITQSTSYLYWADPVLLGSANAYLKIYKPLNRMYIRFITDSSTTIDNVGVSSIKYTSWNWTTIDSLTEGTAELIKQTTYETVYRLTWTALNTVDTNYMNVYLLYALQVAYLYTTNGNSKITSTKIAIYPPLEETDLFGDFYVNYGYKLPLNISYEENIYNNSIVMILSYSDPLTLEYLKGLNSTNYNIFADKNSKIFNITTLPNSGYLYIGLRTFLNSKKILLNYEIVPRFTYYEHLSDLDFIDEENKITWVVFKIPEFNKEDLTLSWPTTLELLDNISYTTFIEIKSNLTEEENSDFILTTIAVTLWLLQNAISVNTAYLGYDKY